jgi:hypothetical protein
MDIHFSLSSAPSTDNPSLLVLREKGYRLEIISYKRLGRYPSCIYIAEKDGHRFAGNSGAELLGIVALWEHSVVGSPKVGPAVMVVR